MISIFILIILNESHADTYAHFLLIFISQGNCRICSSNCQRISRPDKSDSHAGAEGHVVICPHPGSKRGSPYWGGCFEMWVHQDVPLHGPLRDLQQTSQRDKGLHLAFIFSGWALLAILAGGLPELPGIITDTSTFCVLLPLAFWMAFSMSLWCVH